MRPDGHLAIMRAPNNFDTLRILAALAVVVSHSFPLSGSDDLEPLMSLSQRQASAGIIAVYVFFIISGYLITQSFDRSRNAKTFLIARALRLLPALAVVLVILAFAIGPIVSILPASEYFTSIQPYSFLGINLSLWQFSDGLPGVFLSNPFHGAVNGSLWTLSVEAKCYILVLLFGVCGIFNRFTTLGVLIAGCIAMKLWIGGLDMEFYSDFFAGAAIYHWQPPLRGKIAMLCALLWLISFLTVGLRIASASVGAYLIIYLALAPRIKMPNLARWGDLSYGTYIWAFPVQQIASALLGARVSWYLNLAIAIPVVLVLAWLSWHFVEAPALSLKRRPPTIGKAESPRYTAP
jgi:peptidoglycan/LPS O-acetylase OafA/YrhL